MPLIVAKNEVHLKGLQCNAAADWKEFRKHQRIVKKAVEKTKEDWICRIAKEAEVAVKDGHARWDSIRRLQQAHAGRRPTKPSAVYKEDRDLVRDQVRWRLGGISIFWRSSTLQGNIEMT